MSEFGLEPETIIYEEMLAHPILFSHRSPQKIAIIGEQNTAVIKEILKHESVAEVWQIANSKVKPATDVRVKNLATTATAWAPIAAPDYFDCIIVTDNAAPELFPHYFKALHLDGILLQLSGSPFQIKTLKTLQKKLFKATFNDVTTLTFAQPHFPTGWRCALMAKKTGVFKKIREKDIFNKSFTTQYYNFDMHKAALAMPEFMRHGLIDA